MNKLNLAIILTATILLVGCGEKDAKYYYEHPDELKSALDSCQLKVENIAKNNGLDENLNLTKLFNIRIKSDEELVKITNAIAASIKEFSKLESDKTCQQAVIAKRAIEINNLKSAQLNYSDVWQNVIKESIAELEKGKDSLENRYKLEKVYSSLDWSELNKKYKESPCREYSKECNEEEDKILTNYWKQQRETALNKRIEELKAMTFEELHQLPKPQNCQIGFLGVDQTNLDCSAIPDTLKFKNVEKISEYKKVLLTGDVVQNYSPMKENLAAKEKEYCGSSKTFSLCSFYSSANREVKEAIREYLASNDETLIAEYNKCYQSLQSAKNLQEKGNIKFDTPCRIIKEIAAEKISDGDYKVYNKISDFAEPLQNITK